MEILHKMTMLSEWKLYQVQTKQTKMEDSVLSILKSLKSNQGNHSILEYLVHLVLMSHKDCALKCRDIKSQIFLVKKE
jgi:hypothetical protein